MGSQHWFALFLGVLVAAQPQLQQPRESSPYDVVEDVSDNKKEDNVCEMILASHGLNVSTFSESAAHGIHSISLEEIREYFEPNTPLNNKIPVVNSNLSAEQSVLFSAPLAGYDEDFKTMALKVMSFFMRHDRPDFFIDGPNTLEKIAHQYHMHELYVKAAPIYRQLKEAPPKDTNFCRCINDIAGNGILAEMENIAQELKHFSSKRTPRGKGGKATIKGRKKRSTEETWKPNTLVGPEQWGAYEEMLKNVMLDDEGIKDFATFIYCKLNQPE